jgi:transposase
VPNKNLILNLPGFTIKKIEGFSPIIIHLRYRRKAACPYCESQDEIDSKTGLWVQEF